MQSRCSIYVVEILFQSRWLYWQVFYFCGRLGVGGCGWVRVCMEKLRLKLTSAKGEVEVEAELGN